MKNSLQVYNSLTRQLEIFKPVSPPYVGLYVCGPTVYGPSHLGHARCYITFDIIQRYLKHLGYKVRYVRNITDVGHLERDADDGLDKIAKQAQLQKMEPMEVVQRYMNSFHEDMTLLNVESPNIEPQASGYIPEQISMIQELIEKGFAYEANGSVYFNIPTYQNSYSYGKLSNRNSAELLSGTRLLAGQSEKKYPLDFALWKKANDTHIMRWNSPWGEGFPGWHIECTALSTKYLGSFFDMHGGGMDLLFPHHECELAQSQALQGTTLAKYWLHNNLITLHGQKMGKSLGNFITLQELFQGTNSLLGKAYSPMVLRFFILQAHYRSTLSFSEEALEASRKGYLKLINGLKDIKKLQYAQKDTDIVQENIVSEIEKHINLCYEAMNEDFNTAKLIAELFCLLKFINALVYKQLYGCQLGERIFENLKQTYLFFIENILGLQEPSQAASAEFLSVILKSYAHAKQHKNYEQIDILRLELKKLGIILQDAAHGTTWSYS